MMEQKRIFGNDLNEKKMGIINYNFDTGSQPGMTRYELDKLQEELREVREEYERRNKKFVSEEKQKAMWK